MKLTILMLTLAAMITVACNKKEEAAPAADFKPAVEGHSVEHDHVTDGADHAHDDSHHGDHDHKAHHPDHEDLGGDATN
jgi:hypothetical protein